MKAETWINSIMDELPMMEEQAEAEGVNIIMARAMDKEGESIAMRVGTMGEGGILCEMMTSMLVGLAKKHGYTKDDIYGAICAYWEHES